MTWRPTDGLKRSEGVVQQILNDLVACGVPPITNPTARFRMKQVIAEALDGFRSTIEAEPEFPLEERDEAPHSNGSEHLHPTTPDDTDEYRAAFPHDKRVALATHTDPAVVDQYMDKAPKKRSRGRPKLSAAEKKKRKAAKQANAVEAEAAT